MKKILFIITKSEIGGAQKYVLDMASGAKNTGFSVAVASEHRTYLDTNSSRDAGQSASGQGADDAGVALATSRRSDAVSGAEWPHPEGFWRFSSIASLLRVAVGKTTASLSRLALKENRSERGLEASIEIGSDSYFYETLAELGIEFIEIKNLQRSVNFALDAKLLFELIKIIRKEKPDVVHLNSSKIGALGAIAAKLARVPRVIFTAHGWAFNDPRQAWEKYAIIAVSRMVALFQDKIICVSDCDKEAALKYKIAPIEKLVAIHNGINPKALSLLARKEARARLNIDEKSLAVGTIANFYKTKSLDTLVLAAISAIHLSPSIKFVIIGDGPERIKIEELIKKYRLGGYFLLTGALKNAGQYLKAFDIFVMPSKKEGLPYALLEAMAAKTACVASAVGGIPEIIENEKNGLLVKDMSPSKLSDAISRLIKNKKTARALGLAAAETIQSKFSLKQMLEKTLALYDES